jgi:ribosomal protein S18 acetylase RimI-like enzyme
MIMKITITPLDNSNLSTEELSLFFEDYPFEKFYALNLNLGFLKFKAFLVNKVVRRVACSALLWQVRAGKKLVAIFGLDEEKMSSTYCKKIYHLGSFYNFSIYSKEVLSLINKHIIQFCTDSGVEMIRCKIDAEDHDNISYLLSEHYHFNASSCKMYCDVTGVTTRFNKARPGYNVRQYNITDELKALSILSQHRKNELYYNLDLPIDKTANLFDSYFVSQSKTNPGSTLVLEESTTKRIVGVSLHAEPKLFNSKFEKSLITWDLIVIDQNERGKGLGNNFFNYLRNEGIQAIELSTMSDNFQMLKFLHKLGFYKVGEFNFLYKKFS